MSAEGERLREAIARHRAGDHAAAEGAYRAHLRQFPGDPSALHFLGLLRNHQGRNSESIPLMLAALEADPGYVDAWSNLAIAYYQERDLVRSEKCSRKAIELSPDFANAWVNLALTLRALGSLEEALSALGRALELNPRQRNAALYYGQLLYRLDRIPQALEFYRGRLESSPDDPIALHMLAACGGSGCPARASDAYVRTTFDDFAESFDRSLELLQYRAPQLLQEAVMAPGVLPRTVDLEVLDLGCGTGLCGPLLRPSARALVGVDLSPRMLSLSAARGVYDQLNCAELTEWLAACGRTFDLAMAADVYATSVRSNALFPGSARSLRLRAAFAARWRQLRKVSQSSRSYCGRMGGINTSSPISRARSPGRGWNRFECRGAFYGMSAGHRWWGIWWSRGVDSCRRAIADRVSHGLIEGAAMSSPTIISP